MTHTTTDTIALSRLSTPIGPMLVGATEQGVCLLEFIDRPVVDAELAALQRLLQRPVVEGDNPHTRQMARQLADYFAGQRLDFDVPLQAPGTDFQTTVWQALRNVPFGQTASYQALSERIGKPTAMRAVAAANGQNRIAIVIPCHRIIGKDGTLTGYGGGLPRKRWLLDHERRVLGQPSLLPMDDLFANP